MLPGGIVIGEINGVEIPDGLAPDNVKSKLTKGNLNDVDQSMNTIGMLRLFLLLNKVKQTQS